jgi:hypothetical protein
MSLITIVLVLIVVGVIMWLINAYIPMQGTIKSILNAVVVIVLVIWLLQAFGVLGELNRVRIGERSADDGVRIGLVAPPSPQDF